MNLVIFQALLLLKGIHSRYLVLQFYADSFESSQSLGHDLKNMWFGYNPPIFCHFFGKLNLVIFQALLLSACIDGGYLVRATPPTILTSFR